MLVLGYRQVPAKQANLRIKAQVCTRPYVATGDPSNDEDAALLSDTKRRHVPEETCRIDVRLQPHNSADLGVEAVVRLAAGRDMLLAAPVATTGVACYARASQGCILKRGKASVRPLHGEILCTC